jgi:hypothetical protein
MFIGTMASIRVGMALASTVLSDRLEGNPYPMGPSDASECLVTGCLHAASV